MAFAGKAAQRDGWDYQAEHLAVTHTAIGMAAIAVAQQARRRPVLKPVGDHALAAEHQGDPQLSEAGLVEDGSITGTNRSEFEQQLTQRALLARINTLTVLRLAAKKQIAELEGELGSAQDELVRWDNENRSLQTSLELITSENSRLSERLAQNAAAVENDRCQLEQMKTAVAAVEVERDKDRSELKRMKAAVASAEAERDKHRSELDRAKAALIAAETERDMSRSQLEDVKAAAAAATAERNELAAAIEDVYKKRNTETVAFNTYLDVMRSRATTAEQQLEETRQSLVAHTEQNTSLVSDNSRLSRSLAESNTAVETAHSQLDQMKTLLAAAMAERDKLGAALAKADESHHTEIDALKLRLEAACSRAANSDMQLAEVRRSLLEKLELLQNSLQAKIGEVNQLRQSHAKLIEETHMLLKSVDRRDRALADANGKIRLLAELVAVPRIGTKPRAQGCRTDVLLASTVTF